MTEYKPRTTPEDRQRIYNVCISVLDEIIECRILSRLCGDLARAEACLAERDAKIERIKKAAYEKLSISDVMTLGL